jgi:hypothetical protein
MEELPSTGSLQVKVAFDRKEHSAAQLAAMNRGPLLRRPVVTLSAAVVGGLLIVQVDRALHHLLHPAVPLVARALFAVGAMVLVALGIRRTARLHEENERHEQHPDTYTLSDAGLEISGVNDLALMAWSSMTRVHETDRFFLFVSGSEVQYLPKRVLDEEQIECVRGLVARHTPAAARLLPAGPGARGQGSVRRP